MPEIIKSFIVLLILGSAILYFHRINLPNIVSTKEVKQWQVLWFATISTAFLSHNYWLFSLILIAVLKTRIFGDRAHHFSSYLWLLPILPILPMEIPGFGGIRFLFELDFPRILSLVILFPLFLTQTDRQRTFFRLPGDRLIALYLLVNVVLTSRNGELTNILRSNFYLFTDIFLPYYAASRSLRDFTDFKKVAYVIFSAMSILALIGIFEAIRGWHLFSSLSYSLDIGQRFSSYLYREGMLRATAPFSSGIVLGYALTIGIGMGLALSPSIKNKRYLSAIFVLYILGLLATASRGPWVGAFILLLIFIFLSRHKAKLIPKAIIGFIIALPLVLFSSAGQKIINMLPFIGDSNSGSVSYRQELLDKSWIVIQRHPFFGSNTYLDTPEMQSMIQGQGIVDIVNSYVRIALDTGLIGVTLFILFFSTLIIRLYLSQKKIAIETPDFQVYASALIATMIAMMLIIATVSSIDIVNTLYWLFGGILSAYIHFLKQHKLKGPNI